MVDKIKVSQYSHSHVFKSNRYTLGDHLYIAESSYEFLSTFQGNHQDIFTIEKVYFPSQVSDQKSMVLIRWMDG